MKTQVIYNNFVGKKVAKQWIDEDGIWLKFEDGSMVRLHDTEACSQEDILDEEAEEIEYEDFEDNLPDTSMDW